MAETALPSETPAPAPAARPGRLTPLTLLLLLLPLVLLGALIALFATTSGGLHVAPAAPINKLDIERTVLTPAGFVLSVRNVGPEPVTLAQVAVNDAFWPASVEPGPELGRLDRATVHIPYPWVRGEAYEINLITSAAVVIPVEIPVAAETPTPDSGTLLTFSLIGLYVGVIPVFLGMFWYPALRQLGRRTMTFLLALTAGLLVYLGIDATMEALEQSALVAGPWQGAGLIGIGIVLTVMLLNAISQRQQAGHADETSRRLALATTIALGMGLHNLGEGLAIGAAYAVGEVALGAFLVIGFIIQNITEGLGIVIPVLRTRPSLGRLALLGLLGGAPAIVGTWIGGLTYSLPLSVLFLAIGAGAVFQVAWEIGKLMRADEAKAPAPLLAVGGVATGMLLLYVTGVLIK
jgi:zinc transporter, ZIP family